MIDRINDNPCCTAEALTPGRLTHKRCMDGTVRTQADIVPPSAGYFSIRPSEGLD